MLVCVSSTNLFHQQNLQLLIIYIHNIHNLPDPHLTLLYLDLNLTILSKVKIIYLLVPSVTFRFHPPEHVELSWSTAHTLAGTSGQFSGLDPSSVWTNGFLGDWLKWIKHTMKAALNESISLQKASSRSILLIVVLFKCLSMLVHRLSWGLIVLFRSFLANVDSVGQFS